MLLQVLAEKHGGFAEKSIYGRQIFTAEIKDAVVPIAVGNCLRKIIV
jgi:hypothetical protein